MWLLTIFPWYFTQWNSRSGNIKHRVIHIHAFCPTFPWFPCSSSFPLNWPSPTSFERFSLTGVLVRSIPEHLLWHTHPATLVFRDSQCHCLPLYQIERLPCNALLCHLDYPSHHPSKANFRCLKCLQVHYPHHFRLDDGLCDLSGQNLICEFILQGGPLQLRLVAKVNFPTI